MRAVFGVLMLMLVAAPAQAQLGHFFGGVADAREGRQGRTTQERLRDLDRDDERRWQQLRLQQQIEENNRLIREMQRRQHMRQYGNQSR